MKINFSNYKPFSGNHSVEIKRFNIFVGKNNAGKSSLSEIIQYSTNLAYSGRYNSPRFLINDNLEKLGIHNDLFNSKKKIDPLINNHNKDFSKLWGLIAEIVFTEIKLWNLMQAEKYQSSPTTRGLYSPTMGNTKKNSSYKDISLLKKYLLELYNNLYSEAKYESMWMIDRLIETQIKTALEITKSRYNSLNIGVRLHLRNDAKISKLIEFIRPTYRRGIGLKFSISPTRSFRRPDIDEMRYRVSYHNKRQTIERIRNFTTAEEIYDLGVSRLIANSNVKGDRPAFNRTAVFKQYFKPAKKAAIKKTDSFVQIIHDYLGLIIKNSPNQHGSGDVTNCNVNLTDADVDILYNSDSILNKARLSYSSDNLDRKFTTNVKFSFLPDSKMYNLNKEFVNELLAKIAPNFVNNYCSAGGGKIPKKIDRKLRALDPIIHRNNLLYTPYRKGGLFFPMVHHQPLSRKIDRRQGFYERHLFNAYHSSIDNFPHTLKVSNIEGNSSLALNRNNIKQGSSSKSAFIYSKRGKQELAFDPKSNMRVFSHHKVGSWKNDVHCVYEWLTRNPRLNDLIFPYLTLDTSSNKVYGALHKVYADPTRLILGPPPLQDDIVHQRLYKETSLGVFSILMMNPQDSNYRSEDFRSESRMLQREWNQSSSPLEHLYKDLLLHTMELAELDKKYQEHVRKTQKERKKIKPGVRKKLIDFEQFLIGAYLESFIAKILEAIHMYILVDYFKPLTSEHNIIHENVYGQRVPRPTQTTIIDPVIFPHKIDQRYFVDELKLLFGHNIEEILQSESSTKEICGEVNNHLSKIRLPYRFNIGPFKGYHYNDTFRNSEFERTVNTETNEFILSICEVDLDSGKEVREWMDFDQIGLGTRHIISVLMQYAISRRLTRSRDQLLVIREPENYLHPQMIGRFTRYLVYLTSMERLGIVVETHSEIILRQLQVIIKDRGSSLIDEFRREWFLNPETGNVETVTDDRFNDAEYEEDEIVNFKELGIYYIQQGAVGKSKILDLQLNDKGYFTKGIPEDFFDINTRLVRDLRRAKDE